jgi:HK97 family phage prohead protease
MRTYKMFSAGFENIGPRSCRVICSTGDIDMTGEVVEQRGLDLSVYNRNPIVLFGHVQTMPVGTASGVHVDGNRLLADIEFAPAGISQKSDEICALVKSGVLKSISIGFDPTETEPMDPKRSRGPLRYKRAILVEISVVSCPANTNAVIYGKAFSDSAESTDLNSSEGRELRAIKARLSAVRGLRNSEPPRTHAEMARTTTPNKYENMTRDQRINRAMALRARGEPSVAPPQLSLTEITSRARAAYAAATGYEDDDTARSTRIIRAAELRRRAS